MLTKILAPLSGLNVSRAAPVIFPAKLRNFQKITCNVRRSEGLKTALTIKINKKLKKSPKIFAGNKKVRIFAVRLRNNGS